MVRAAGFEVSPRDGLFRLFGDLDGHTAPILERAMEDAVGAGGPVVLDVRDLRSIDPDGVRLLRKTAFALRDGCLIVHGVHPAVEEILDMVRPGTGRNIHVTPCSYASSR